ncbi:YncE family protein [Stygiolobus caldivivus]|uniref:YncE family protein n=1 Tax=Stygiolobus caldivivus TaxID=2824673 RepID=A0A8D5U454_9CREN|nr:hypothetical protein [Stygiolobus caldivivus]BCU68928.1 hypothetical protein KN1_02250 [Stygiolobus caldivivus]
MNRITLLAILLLITSILVSASTITVNTISTASGPSYGVYADGKIIIVAQGAFELQCIENNTIVNTIPLPHDPADPFKVAYDQGYLFVIYQKGPLVVLKDGKVISTYNIPHVGKYPDILTAGKYVAVTASNGYKVYFFTPSGEIGSVSVEPNPQALAYDNYTNTIYVGAYGYNVIDGISLSTMKVTQQIKINATVVDTMTFVPPDLLAVATYNQQVEFINVTSGKVVATASFSPPDTGIFGYSQITYDPADGYVLLSIAHHNDLVAVISTNGEVKYLVTVGNSPNGIIFDPQNNYVYVLNYGSNSISYFLSPNITTHTVSTSSNFTLLYMVVVVIIILLVVGGIVAFRRRK